MINRLDAEIYKRGLVRSRNIAADLIMNEKVRVNQKIIIKPSHKITETDTIEIIELPKYVSRAGYKLEGAIEDFGIKVTDKICLDVGSSTGGFTDCLLQKGAKKVYAFDVGENQFDKNLLKDERVILSEKTDIRKVESIPEQIDLAVIDVSFISLELVLPTVFRLVKSGGEVVALVKPQFEVGKDNVGKGGIVKDEKMHQEVLDRLQNFIESQGKQILNKTISKIKGSDGNIEFFLHIKN